MKYAMLSLLLLPALLCAQEFQFQLETNTIPVDIEGWNPYVPWAGGVSESNPALVDIDADGDLDFFVGEYFGWLQYFRNNGIASNPYFILVSLQYDSIYVTESRNNPCFRDLDADGDLDLLVGDIDSNLQFYRNLGTPQSPDFFLEDSSLIPGPPWWGIGPELVDIEADGDYDLFGGYYGQLSFYENIGTPEEMDFSLVTQSFSGINVGDRALPEFVDIDADGDYDLFIGNRNGNIWHYRNDGDSLNYNFTFVTNFYSSIWVDYAASPEFVDIDADGDYDLFVGRENENNIVSPGDIFFYENVGNSTTPQWQLVTKNYLSLDQGKRSQNRHADIDADGDVDLFSANRGDYITHYENIGSQDSASYRWVTDTYQDIHVSGANISLKDMDADQDYDLFVGEALVPNPPYPGLHLYQNRGTPQNASFSLYTSNLVPQNYFVAIIPDLADIDGDGDQDLFITDHQDTRYYFENVGSPANPSFTSPVINWWFGAFPPDSVSYIGLFGFCFYDIDNDGDLDMFGVPTGYEIFNWVWFYLNVGTAQSPQYTLVTEELLTFETQEKFSGIDIFDIDNDGDGDILLSVGYGGGIYFFRNVTGEPPAVPPAVKHPQAGFHLSIGPNPANPVTVISFSLPYPQEATLAVYNLLGARVATLTSGLQPPSEQSFLWDARGNASGVYIVRLEAVGEMRAGKILVVK